MPPPTVSVKVDWTNDGDFTDPIDDITADVGGTDPHSTAVVIGRGGSADFGSGTSQGGASFVVRNDTGKYNRENGSSPLVGNLKPGRPVWVTATYSAVTYGLFAGYIAKIIPDPRTKLATIVCDDPLARFAKVEASVADSLTRSLKDYRGAILDTIGELSTRRDLADEPEIPGYTGERTASALDLLAEVNASTLSRHFIRPGTVMPNWYFYTTRDRHYRLDAAATITLPDVLADMSGYELSDETLINDQFVAPSGRAISTSEQLVWSMPELPVNIAAGGSKVIWAQFSEPVVSPRVEFEGEGTPIVALTALGTSAKITITAGATDPKMSRLQIYGRPAEAVDGIRVRKEDASSIAGYGRYTGEEIRASLLTTTGQAQGLADHMVFRFKDPRTRPVATLQNVFPEILQAELFEPVSLTFARLSLAARRFEITGLQLEISGDRNTWTQRLQLQEAPEQGNPPAAFFTLNSDVLNGTARLGY